MQDRQAKLALVERSLERAGRDFLVRGNKFLHIDDYDFAQQQLDSQLDTQWEQMLCGFLATVFPAKEAIVGPHLSYYWTLWQSEWATDLIYPSPKDIAPITNSASSSESVGGFRLRKLAQCVK